MQIEASIDPMNANRMAQENSETLEKVKSIFTAYLERKNLRKTPERYSILEEIYLKDDHFDADSLFIAMKNKNYRVSRATIYNTLDLLVECNLVTKHLFDKNMAQFEKSYGYRQHDHMICLDCNHVYEFCDPRIYSIEKSISGTLDMKLEHRSLTFYGNCQKENCENKRA